MREFSEAERRTLLRLFAPAAAKEMGPSELAQFEEKFGPNAESERAYSAAWRVGALHRWCSAIAATMLDVKAVPAARLAKERRALLQVERAAAQLLEATSLCDSLGFLTNLFPLPGAATGRSRSETEWSDRCAFAYRTHRAMRIEIERLRDLAHYASDQARPRRGPPINYGRAVFMEHLCRELMFWGLPFQTAEDSPMVEACSIVWEALEIEGDIRGTLRRVNRIFGTQARLEAELIEPPKPQRQRPQGGRNSA